MSSIPVTYQQRVPIPTEPPLGVAPSVSGFTIGDAIAALKQRIFLILFVWFVIIGTTAGITYIMLKYFPKYSASAYVFVESPNPALPFTLESKEPSSDVLARVMMDQAVLVKSDEVLMQALQDSTVISTNWYQSFPQEQGAQRLKELNASLSVAPVTGTAFLGISMACKNQADPHRIVNTVMEKYLRYVDSLSRIRFKEQINEYKAQKRGLERDIDQLGKEKEAFIQQMDTPGVTGGMNYGAQALVGVTQELTLLEADQTRYKTLYETLRDAGAKQLAVSPEMEMMIQNDPKIADLSNMLARIENAQMMSGDTLGQNHIENRNMQRQINALREALDRETAIKRDQIRQFEMNNAEMNWLSATQAVQQLTERKLELEDQQRDLDRQLVKLQDIQDRLEKLQNSHEQIDQYLRMLDMIVQSSSTVRVHEASKATAPIEPSSPRVKLNMAAGTFVGLIVAIGLALLLEFADTSVRTPRDVSRHVHVPILGTVIDSDDEEVAIEPVELAAKVAPHSLMAESFRSIRTNLLLSAPAERQRTILITSPKPEDGKSTIATNLAISIAQSGRRVLLIDANFRRPVLHEVFKNGHQPGLSNALIGQAQLDQMIRKTDLPNLDIILPGPIPPNPAELLSSQYMHDLLAEATQRYDQVLFDGPPVLLVSDALVLAGLVDGVILVVRAKKNSRGVAQRARDQLERVNAHVFGAVLNRAQARRGGYFREQFRTFYDYRPDDLESQAAAALPAEPTSDHPSDDEET